LCVCVLSVLLGAMAAPVAQAGTTLWTVKSDQEIRWHQLTDLGTLLVATDDGISCLDPETGKPIWKRDDLKKIPDYHVEEIVGTPLLLVTVNEGNKTKLHAVDLLTGQNIWETERLKGATIGVVPVYQKNMVLLLTSRSAGASKDKPDMIALDMATGEVRWEAEFPDRVDFHAVEGAGRWGVKYDLSGHQPPVYDGDSIYFTYAGLHRFDLNTGKLVWGVPYDVTEGRIKRGNAAAVIDGDTIFTSAKGEIRAHDKASGQVKWTSKHHGGAVAQMILKGDVLYGRMGGHFYDYGKREWVLEKPLGVVALNKNTGATIWVFDKAQDGITNMVLLENPASILIADSKNLIGLDTTREGKIKEAFKTNLEFKNKIGGGAKAARAGMKFARGGLIGMAKKSHEDEDPPVIILMRKDGTAVVQAKQHLLAFDPKSQQIPWSVEYEAPGVPNWQKLVMFAMTAAAYGYSFNEAAHTQLGSSENTWANQNKGDVMKLYQAFFFKRFSATRAGGQFVYIMTNIEEGGDKGAGIIGVNMDSGGAEQQILFKTKDPNYKVDEITGRIFNVKDGKELTAYSVK
jgi:outer membrane protein assembly factor BamB